jgi:hypothetical protein
MGGVYIFYPRSITLRCTRLQRPLPLNESMLLSDARMLTHSSDVMKIPGFWWSLDAFGELIDLACGDS